MAEPAFWAFVHWAIGMPDMRGQFEQDTGMVCPSPARSGLEQMIDEASGWSAGYVRGFVEWAYREWGAEPEDDHAP